MPYQFPFMARAYHGAEVALELLGRGKREVVVDLRKDYREKFGIPARAVKLYIRTDEEPEWKEIPIP